MSISTLHWAMLLIEKKNLLQGLVFFFFVREKLDSMDVFGQLRQAEVNEFHLLHPPKADGAHESL